MNLDLTTATPAQIDAELVVIAHRIANLNGKIDRQDSIIEMFDKTPSRSAYEEGRRDAAIASKARFEAAVAAEKAQAAPLHAEFTRRGGWTRFFLVTNTGGHVHRTTSCSTCYATTQFAWLPEQSGMTEAEVVALAGEAACTVCFPDAPVAGLARPSRIETPEVKAKRIAAEQARAEREAAAKAKALTMPDGSPVMDSDGQPFKTERAATNARTAAIKNLAWYQEHPWAPQWIRVVRDVNEAVAAKHGRTVQDEHAEAMKKAKAAYRREFGADMPAPRGL